MKIGVLGTGYVGLVAGTGFADLGNDVACADVDVARVGKLRGGQLPLYEPNLLELLRSNMAAGRLRFTSSVCEAVRDAEVVLICVGTPTSEDGSADLSQVLAAAVAVGKSLSSPFTAVILKSTVPVGTAERVRDLLAQHSPLPFGVASNPEFLKEGSAVEDFLRPMRIVVGIGPRSGRGLFPEDDVDARMQRLMRRLYAPLMRTEDRLLLMEARSAEITKYACNAYLATRVSFINDIANLCERVGADVEMVRRGMGTDVRIGPRFLFPGIGYGGSCFPKDTRALIACAQSSGTELPIVAAAEQINARQKRLLVDKLIMHFGGAPDRTGNNLALEGKVLAVWGLAFKPETDDVREAPALALIEQLVEAGARVRASDPAAGERALQALSEPTRAAVEIFPDAYEAARGADALLLCTEWRQYRQPDFQRLRQLLRGTAIFDGRNIWDSLHLHELGLVYYGIGRPDNNRKEPRFTSTVNA